MSAFSAENLSASGEVPHDERTVRGARREVSIGERRERNTVHVPICATKRATLGAQIRAPHLTQASDEQEEKRSEYREYKNLDSGVFGGRQEVRAIGGVRDRGDGLGMARKGRDLLARPTVPQDQTLVHRAILHNK